MPMPTVKPAFQSTHPSRGATGQKVRIYGRKRISIHAPLTGCDNFNHKDNIFDNNFNPRTPHGVRQANTWDIKSNVNFNPRTPHGVRLISLLLVRILLNFNPRTPHGVRRISKSNFISSSRFQSTHPSRGATGFYSSWRSSGQYFNPRTPHGVRLKAICHRVTKLLFQSTHPSRGATRSIHTSFTFKAFQSTHPSRGATWRPDTVWFVRCHFNPRTPHGVRLF